MAEHCKVGFDTMNDKVSQIRKGNKGQGRKLSYPKEVDEKILEWLLCICEMYLAVSTTQTSRAQRDG